MFSGSDFSQQNQSVDIDLPLWLGFFSKWQINPPWTPPFPDPWALAMGRQAPRHSVSAGCTLHFKHPQQRWCYDKLRAPHHCPAISNIGYLGHERTPPGIASSWLTGFFRMLRKTRWDWLVDLGKWQETPYVTNVPLLQKERLEKMQLKKISGEKKMRMYSNCNMNLLLAKYGAVYTCDEKTTLAQLPRRMGQGNSHHASLDVASNLANSDPKCLEASPPYHPQTLKSSPFHGVPWTRVGNPSNTYGFSCELV